MGAGKGLCQVCLHRCLYMPGGWAASVREQLVHRTGRGLPTANSAQDCSKLARGGICSLWCQWIPNTSLPRALWRRRKTSQISQFFGEMWFCARALRGHMHISAAKLVTFSSSWWLWWDVGTFRASCLGMRWAVSWKAVLISRACGICQGLCWRCQNVTKPRHNCSAWQKPALTLQCWRCSVFPTHVFWFWWGFFE